MKLTRNSVESALRDYAPRTKVGNSANPLQRVFTRLGVTVDITSPKPVWLRKFVEAVQTLNNNSISARAALNLLSTIK